MWRPESIRFPPIMTDRCRSSSVARGCSSPISPRSIERRERRAHDEILNDETRGKRPRYYLQNFHFQSGGWMTEDSAERYDTQVEVLFNGAANAIRRQALPPLQEAFAGRDQRKLRLLDIGCGTGRFLDFVKQAWPRLLVHGFDMSEAYIRHARRHLRGRSRTGLAVGKAEAIPVPDDSQDAVTGIFLFHELPPKVRREAVCRICPRAQAGRTSGACWIRCSAAIIRIMRAS